MSLFHRCFSDVFGIANPLPRFVHMLKIVDKWVKTICLNDCSIFYLISNTSLLKEIQTKEKETEKQRKKLSERNTKISKM